MCANFFWAQLERQVRMIGTAKKVDSAQSDAYFDSRPRESQLGAWASHQSEELKNHWGIIENILVGKVVVNRKKEGNCVFHKERWRFICR